MGMPRGLIKSNAYWNKIEALNDYRKLMQISPEIAKDFPVKDNWGWRRIDKQTLKLRLAIEAAAQKPA